MIDVGVSVAVEVGVGVGRELVGPWCEENCEVPVTQELVVLVSGETVDCYPESINWSLLLIEVPSVPSGSRVLIWEGRVIRCGCFYEGLLLCVARGLCDDVDCGWVVAIYLWFRVTGDGE